MGPLGTRNSRRFLSLRWKALIALSFVLVLVNASLAYLAYRQSARQFDLQQSAVRERQDSQLRAMVADRVQEMSKLSSLVPLFGPNPPLADRASSSIRHCTPTAPCWTWNGTSGPSTGSVQVLRR